jgi:cytochrome P450
VVAVLIFGGLHTSRSAMLESLFYIGRNEDVRQQLLQRFDDAPFWEGAVEEFIRYSTPTQCVKRQLSQDTVLHGQAMTSGDDVMLMWGSANHDERQFEQPDQVLLERSPNAHTAFGVGAHRCIGQHLARVFIRAALRRTLALMPDYRIPDEFTPEYQAGEARAMTCLPVTLPSR